MRDPVLTPEHTSDSFRGLVLSAADPSDWERVGADEMDDFRDEDQKQADLALVGTWWRCPDHALTDEPILLGHVAYCPSEECDSQVKLVHSAINDPNANAQARSVWRKSSDLFLAPVKDGKGGTKAGTKAGTKKKSAKSK